MAVPERAKIQSISYDLQSGRGGEMTGSVILASKIIIVHDYVFSQLHYNSTMYYWNYWVNQMKIFSL